MMLFLFVVSLAVVTAYLITTTTPVDVDECRDDPWFD